VVPPQVLDFHAAREGFCEIALPRGCGRTLPRDLRTSRVPRKAPFPSESTSRCSMTYGGRAATMSGGEYYAGAALGVDLI
jgi:hypothetical protein